MHINELMNVNKMNEHLTIDNRQKDYIFGVKSSLWFSWMDDSGFMALSISYDILSQAANEGKRVKLMKHPFEQRPRPRANLTIGAQVQCANY